MQVRQQEGNREPKARNQELDDSICAQQRLGRLQVATVGPAADQIAPGAETQHEERDDQGGGMDGRAEDGAELADPDNLVDQTADAGTEEEEIEQRRGHLDFAPKPERRGAGRAPMQARPQPPASSLQPPASSLLQF